MTGIRYSRPRADPAGPGGSQTAAGASRRDARGPAGVSVRKVSKHYPDGTVALNEADLEVEPGELLTVLGPSGCGKTTLLRVIVGLITPTSGTIAIGDRDVTRLQTRQRDVGMVFQHYALFPHMSVFDNIAYPLRIRRARKEEIQDRVMAALERVKLEGLADRLPGQLSGGQAQRVAVARAVVYEPQVLLLDEPLAALDRALRKHMQYELRTIQQDLGITCVSVTHDQEEALVMSDRIAVMRAARIVQIGTPGEVYGSPADVFVAGFMGAMNMLAGRLRGGAFVTDGGVSLPAGADTGERASATLAIRPEAIEIGPAGELPVGARVVSVAYLGNLSYLDCALTSGETLRIQVAGRPGRYAAGDACGLSWRADDARVF